MLQRCIFVFILFFNFYLKSYALENSVSTSKSNSSDNTKFTFKRLILSDTEYKVLNLRFPNDKGKLLIMDIPILNTKEFDQLIEPFIGKALDQSLIDTISSSISNYLKSKNFPPPAIIIPEQNISKGELRIVVVIGKFMLSHLFLTSSAKINSADLQTLQNKQTNSDSKHGQIYLDDLPPYFATPELGKLIAPYFAKPITSDSVNNLVGDIATFISQKGGYLAAAEAPDQNVENGSLKIALEIGYFPIKHFIITNTFAESRDAQFPNKTDTVFTVNNPLYSTSEFRSYISRYIGKPITVKLISEIRKDLVEYAKNHDRLLVNTFTPHLDLKKGEIRIAVSIGRYNQLHLKGNNWFSDKLLEEKLGIKPGDEIKISELDSAVNWANQNPFRQISVMLDTINQPAGIANLDVEVRESRPVHFSASFSNAINSPLGNSSYTASSQFGNLWGLDHQLTYQYSTNNTPKYDQQHTLDYKAPLFWHDFIKVDLAYSMVSPRSLFGYVGLNEKAKNIVADIRYIKPITRGLWSFEYSAAVDYKQVNTNLEFGTLKQPIATYDVAEFNLGETVVKKDTLGNWTAGINLNVSPGGLNSRNTESSYGFTSSGGATGRSSLYEYGKFVIERDTNIFWGFQWVSRGQIQISSTNLQGSEQILLGGGATVRGYSQSYSGDQGYVINEELRSPYKAWRLPFTHSRNSLLNTQVVSFWDYGQVTYKHVIPSDIALPSLMGAGIGIRASILGYLSAGSDMSWPIFKPTYSDSHPTKGTFWISLTY